MQDDKIKVEGLHSEAQIMAEVQSCIKDAPLFICLGHVMRLASVKSPYIYGGTIEPYDTEVAAYIMMYDCKDLQQFHEDFSKELETAFRPYGIVEGKAEETAEHSEIEVFSPEWMADLIGLASQSLSMTYDDALWKIPMTMMAHLALATARRHGLITKRPMDVKAALKALKEKKL